MGSGPGQGKGKDQDEGEDKGADLKGRAVRMGVCARHTLRSFHLQHTGKSEGEAGWGRKDGLVDTRLPWDSGNLGPIPSHRLPG